MASEKRVERLKKQILRILSKIVLFELNDPRLGSMITLTRVSLTKDLSYATIYFSVLGDNSEQKRVLYALKHAKKHLRSELGKELVIRSLPEIDFEYDESIDGALNIIRKLEELKKEFTDEEDSGEEDNDGNGDDSEKEEDNENDDV